ncbi:hypothetical protein [Streptococcus suis]
MAHDEEIEIGQEMPDEEVEALKGDGTDVLIRLIEEYNYRLEETDE